MKKELERSVRVHEIQNPFVHIVVLECSVDDATSVRNSKYSTLFIDGGHDCHRVVTFLASLSCFRRFLLEMRLNLSFVVVVGSFFSLTTLCPS